MTLQFKNLSLLAPCLLSLILCGGCGGGPNTAEVAGTITIDGKPVPEVQVTFQPVDGSRASVGVTDATGRYRLDYSPSASGALIGEHRVTITAADQELEADEISTDSTMLEGPSNPANEYRGVEKKVTVESGSNSIDITFP